MIWSIHPGNEYHMVVITLSMRMSSFCTVVTTSFTNSIIMTFEVDKTIANNELNNVRVLFIRAAGAGKFGVLKVSRQDPVTDLRSPYRGWLGGGGRALR